MSKNPLSGTYYIRKRSSGWYLYFQKYIEGKRVQEPVDKNAMLNIGFKPNWSVDEAVAHCKQLNGERSLTREKIRVAAKRVTEIKTINEVLFPQNRITEFEHLLGEENFGSEAHLLKLHSHFHFIQAMCNELRILPSEYKTDAKKIYKYFIKKKISPNYSGRIISLLNRWGKFVSKINGAYYEDVPAPRGREKSAIADAQQTKSGKDTELGVRTESLPLTPSILKKAKESLIPEQHDWLFLSIWLGLRPEEVELLKDPKRCKTEQNQKKKVKVIHIYQSKLQSISEDKRWKAIPIIFPEQATCLKIIEDQKFKKPLYKTMRKHVGKGITLYGGRKGFVDLMLGLNQKLEHISMWLGHKDISTTWSHYKDKSEIDFTQVDNRKVRLIK